MVTFMEEDIITDIIINELVNKYYLNKENLLRYLIIRYSIVENIESSKIENVVKHNKDFITFILDELNIYHNGTSCIFNNKELNILSHVNFSLSSILDSIFFRYSIEYKDIDYSILFSFVRKEISNIRRSGTLNSNKYKIKDKDNKELKNNIYLYFALKELNKNFNIVPKKVISVKGFKMKDKLSLLEDKLFYEFKNFFKKINSKIVISEEDLEKHIMKEYPYLDNIKIIGRQISLGDGVIDLLGKTDKGKHYIIELKNTSCERLLWQAIYYPLKFKKSFNTKDVGFIAISTSYNRSIYDPMIDLKEKGYDIEMLTIDIETKNGKIINSNIKKTIRPDL